MAQMKAYTIPVKRWALICKWGHLCNGFPKSCMRKVFHKFNATMVSMCRLNFSDMEIEIFCSSFDADGNAIFTLNEIAEIAEGGNAGPGGE